MADQNQDMQARYQGLQGLVRLLVGKLYGPAGSPNAPYSTDMTRGHYDTGNNAAVGAEVNPRPILPSPAVPVDRSGSTAMRSKAAAALTKRDGETDSAFRLRQINAALDAGEL
jgi:hypothetical protein